MIALVDYGAGNLTSVRKGLNAAGASIFTPAAPGDLASAQGIIIPGSFPQSPYIHRSLKMSQLGRSGPRPGRRPEAGARCPSAPG